MGLYIECVNRGRVSLGAVKGFKPQLLFLPPFSCSSLFSAVLWDE